MDTLRKFYTEDQVKRYFINKNVRKNDIHEWTSQQLVLYVYVELMESAGAVADYVHALCSEKGYGCADIEQQQTLIHLQREGTWIPILIDTLRRWLFLHNVIMENGMPKTEEQFIPEFVKKKEEMPNILAWTDEEFILYASEQLTQSSMKVLGIIADILDGDVSGSPDDGQYGTLLWLQEEIEVIYQRAETFRLWLLR